MNRFRNRAELTVAAVISSTEEPSAVVAGVRLKASAAGLSLHEPSGSEVRSWQWDEVERLSAGAFMTGLASDGGGGSDDGDVPAAKSHRRVLELWEEGRRHELHAESSDLVAFLVASASFAPSAVVLATGVPIPHPSPADPF